MRTDHIVNANTALEAQADHCEQLAKAFESDAEKMRSLAKLLRTSASKEALPGDPKIEVKPNTPFSLRRIPADSQIQNGNEGERAANA